MQSRFRTLMTRAAWTLVLAVALVTSAQADPNLSQLEKRVDRSSTHDFDHLKAVCVCQDGGPLNGLSGAVTSLVVPATFPVTGPLQGLKVLCAVFGFDPAGAPADFDTCDTFTVLPR